VKEPVMSLGGAPTVASGSADLQELTEEECLSLLAATQVGRLGIVIRGQPMVYPVNYVVHERRIIVRTDAGTKQSGASLARVAFEIDGFDSARRTGWSVMVQGMGHDITDSIDVISEHLKTLTVSSWAPGRKPRLLRIDPSIITGRRFGD